jgi:hypothetical protein
MRAKHCPAAAKARRRRFVHSGNAMKCPVTFQAGSRVLAEEDYDAVLDRFFADPHEFVAWLLETEAWRDGDTLWFVLQNYAQDFHGWLCRQRDQLPPEPPGEAREQPHDPAWGLRMLTAVMGWLIARDAYQTAENELIEHPGDPVLIERLRATQRALEEAVLDFPRAHRQSVGQRTVMWTDYSERRYVQGLNVPPPWGGPNRKPPRKP